MSEVTFVLFTDLGQVQNMQQPVIRMQQNSLVCISEQASEYTDYQ